MPLHDPNADAPPFNPVPPVIVALALVIGGIEVVFQMADRGLIGGPEGIAWRARAIERFGFYDPMFDRMVELGVYPLQGMIRFATYSFVHASFVHAAFAVVMILAIGNMAARIFSPVAVLIAMAAGAAGGAAMFGLVWATQQWLFGAYPAVYALLGLYTWVLWMYPGELSQSRAAAFRLIAALLFLQLVFAGFFGGGQDIVADGTGFLIGFFLAFVLAPDGADRVRRWIQRLRDRD